jgi:hypothetical protein
VVLFVSYFTGRPRRDVIVVFNDGAQGALASLKAARHLGDQDDASGEQRGEVKQHQAESTSRGQTLRRLPGSLTIAAGWESATRLSARAPTAPR